MDDQIVRQVLDELLPSIEAIEAQSSAALQFLKAKGIATEEELAPYIQQAGRGASVRWLATRARIEFLLLSAIKDSAAKASEEKAAGQANRENDSQSTAEGQPQPADEQPAPQAAAESKPVESLTQSAKEPSNFKDPKESEGSAA